MPGERAGVREVELLDQRAGARAGWWRSPGTCRGASACSENGPLNTSVTVTESHSCRRVRVGVRPGDRRSDRLAGDRMGGAQVDFLDLQRLVVYRWFQRKSPHAASNEFRHAGVGSGVELSATSFWFGRRRRRGAVVVGGDCVVPEPAHVLRVSDGDRSVVARGELPEANASTASTPRAITTTMT